MKPTGKSVIRAAAMLLGTVVGAGIFGVPYAIVRGGTIPAIVSFVFVGFVVIFFYLLYGEVILRTKTRHRLPGFAERYLGAWGKRIATISSVVGVYGVLTAHGILGGIFLQAVIGPYLGGGARMWGVIYFFIVTIITYFGLGVVARVESALTVSFLILIALITGWALLEAQGKALLQPGSGDIFLPYGVIFFSLLGSTAIPQMRDALGSRTRLLGWTMVWTLLVAIVGTALFAFAVVGVSGGATSQDALQGLVGALGSRVIVIGSVIGLLTVATTSFAVALYLREVYQYDFKIKKSFAWILVVAVPLALYLAVSPSFINTLAVTGAFMGGLDGILIALMHRRAIMHGDRIPEYHITAPRIMSDALIIIFALGILIGLYKLF